MGEDVDDDVILDADVGMAAVLADAREGVDKFGQGDDARGVSIDSAPIDGNGGVIARESEFPFAIVI